MQPDRQPDDHHRDLAEAFDGQAARFERAPVQADPAALRRLVEAADLPPDSLVLDAGCGPGLVGRALLDAGHRVVGFDLSTEMVDRARARCAEHGDRARFERRAVDSTLAPASFDAAISRYVLHHVADPARFLADQVAAVRPGGVLVLGDHTTAVDPEHAEAHAAIERLRDRTHTRNRTAGAIVDLFAAAGLESIRASEEPFTLDFDEWFDRGTPAAPKAEVRTLILAAPPIRSFRAEAGPDGRLTLHCWRAIVRGVVPGRPAARLVSADRAPVG